MPESRPDTRLSGLSVDRASVERPDASGLEAEFPLAGTEGFIVVVARQALAELLAEPVLDVWGFLFVFFVE